MNTRFKKADKNHIIPADELVMKAYQEEIKSVSFLPIEDNYQEMFQKRIEKLFINGSGVVVIDNNQVIGFLAGYKGDELFGKCKGIYCPPYGHGAVKENRRRIYQELYKFAADMWVKEGYTQHAITLYAQDKETLDTWFWLGFGLRCIDAMREVAPINIGKSDIDIKKVGEADISLLADLQNKHHIYYKNSPIFIPLQEEEPIKYLKEWISKDNHHLWMACRDEKPIGFMKIEPSGERFITEHPVVMNITGAYVDETARKLNVGSSLLGVIQEWLFENKYKLCGVDYESINTIGSNFWNKYFTPYTYSVVRRIDERVINKMDNIEVAFDKEI